MELKETVVSTCGVFEGRILSVRVDTIRLPDGGRSTREVVAHRGAVCIVPVRDDGAVVMVRQFRLPAGKVLLELPAGTLDSGEAPASCAERELEEETGYRAASWEPLFAMYMAPGYSEELIHAFLATDLTPVPAHTDADENVEVEAIPFIEAERMAVSGKLEDAKTIAALLVAARRWHAPPLPEPGPRRNAR